MITPPAENEYAAYYADYVARVRDADVLAVLGSQITELRSVVARWSEADAGQRTPEGKWSVKEILGHLGDAERVFGYRALRFARGDENELPGYDQDLFVDRGELNSRTVESLLEELEYLRKANLLLFRSLSSQALQQTGIASKNRVSVRALIYITAGHLGRHIELLRERAH